MEKSRENSEKFIDNILSLQTASESCISVEKMMAIKEICFENDVLPKIRLQNFASKMSTHTQFHKFARSALITAAPTTINGAFIYSFIGEN